MCGIVGFLNLDGGPANARVLRDMLLLQRHRGPDDSGLRMFSLARQKSLEVAVEAESTPRDNSFEGALGFNRLAIRDLSIQGHQPMCNANGSVILAFNGEIYNSSDYRAELESAGYVFRSSTDTEVILYLYEHLGLERMLDRLNGMFATCIVDMNRREVVLARDHFGIKPLYWTTTGGTMMFSSEIKSFLRHPKFHAELDATSIDEYTAFRYCAGYKTLLSGVEQLEPGHILRITAHGIQKQQYWEIPRARNTGSLNEVEALAHLDEKLAASVERQLVSDVGLGSQLSGGVDSSLVTYYAKRRSDVDLEAFSIIFRDKKYSEEEWIAKASSMVEVRSHLFEMDVSDIMSSLEIGTWHLDQPLNIPNSLGIFLLAKRSKPLVTVLLSGEGADELFGGYSRFYDSALRSRLYPNLAGLERLPKLGRRVKRKFNTSLSAADAFIMSSAALDVAELIELRPGIDLPGILEGRRRYYDGCTAPDLGEFQKYDMRTYMVDLLVRQDKMTMAHSVENRVPFLDRDLVQFVRSLHTSQLVGNSLLFNRGYSKNTKIILKKLAEQKYNHDFAFRKKSGFPLPLEEFFQEPQFVSYMEELILPGIRARGIFDSETVTRWWNEIGLGGRNIGRKLWIAVAFEVWARSFLDGKDVR